MEKRRNRRRRLRLPVTLDPGGITSGTMDLSVQGIFVRTGRVLAPGTAVHLALLIPAGPVWAEGVVRWAKRVPSEFLAHTKGGMGIQLTACAPELRDYLGDLFDAELVIAAG